VGGAEIHRASVIGWVVYGGRQVHIDGVRCNLDAIEAQLEACPSVAAAVALVPPPCRHHCRDLPLWIEWDQPALTIRAIAADRLASRSVRLHAQVS
jgi:hypothetical protein